jgi:hypothetical protein
MCCTENQPWKDSLKEINRQGCKQEDGLKGFRVMNQQHFFNGEVSSSGVDDSHSKVEGEEIRHKSIWLKVLLENIITKQGTITKRLRG